MLIPMIKNLYIYPIKSCGAVEVDSIEIDQQGPRFDREWMLVDENGKFLSQRRLPLMAHFLVNFEKDNLKVTSPNGESLLIPLGKRSSEKTPIKVWKFEGLAEDCGDSAANFFSEHLGLTARLVRSIPELGRQVSQTWTNLLAETRFSDGYPLLVLSEQSIEAIEAEAKTPIDIRRFRPNIVVTAAHPFAEDEWQLLKLPELTLDCVKPCERCQIPTMDPVHLKQQPNVRKALEHLRMSERGILVGQNAVPNRLGTIRRGESIQLLKRG